MFVWYLHKSDVFRTATEALLHSKVWYIYIIIIIIIIYILYLTALKFIANFAYALCNLYYKTFQILKKSSNIFKNCFHVINLNMESRHGNNIVPNQWNPPLLINKAYCTFSWLCSTAYYVSVNTCTLTGFGKIVWNWQI